MWKMGVAGVSGEVENLRIFMLFRLKDNFFLEEILRIILMKALNLRENFEFWN